MIARDSAAAVRSLVGHTGPGIERQVSTDQANLSVAVDEQYLVKWFRDPVDRADLVVLEQLAANGFAHMPRFVGPVLDGDRVVAVVSELIVGATDGWQWYVDDVLAWLDGTADLDGLVGTAARMGAITADLHHALADGSTHRSSLDALRAQIADRRGVAVGHTAGEAGDRLRARLGQIDAALAVLATNDEIVVQRIHGDLHAGQFLRVGDRLLVTDFDGDPMTASAERVELQPVERDLAALLQSLDHVGRVAAKRRPGANVEPFVSAAIGAAGQAYCAAHAVDEALLWPLRVAQELHEYAYAATRLPVWGYVPDAAMCALFPDEDGE